MNIAAALEHETLNDSINALKQNLAELTAKARKARDLHNTILERKIHEEIDESLASLAAITAGQEYEADVHTLPVKV